MNALSRAPWLWGLIAFAAAAAIAWAPTYAVHLATLIVIQALLALSLNLLMGYAGLTSFGHAALFGVGAYGAAVLALKLAVPVWWAALGGVALAVAVGALFALATAGARGVYFLLATLALGQVTWGLAFRWVSLTGGDNGLVSVPRPAAWFGLPLGGVADFYLFALVVFAASAAILARVARSPFGYGLRGIRESERRMRALGFDVRAHVFAAFVVSSLFAGLAGVVYVFYNRFVSPQDLHVSLSAQAALTVIIGGAGTTWGPIAGAAILVLLQNLVSSATQRWVSVLGLIYIAVVLFQPQGLAGLVLHLRARKPAPPRPEGA